MTIKKGLYEHFKGGWYHVIGTATHTETGEEMVIYYHEGEPSKLWVRPASMWFERINGKPRFEFIGSNYTFSDGNASYSFEPQEVRGYE